MLATRQGATLVGPVDLRVRDGERWALLGPNGSGKTSLLLMAGARRQPVRGRVKVLGRRMGESDVRTLRPRIGHTSHRLADDIRPGMPALEAVLTGTRGALESWLTEFTDGERASARRRLDEVGCGGLAERAMGTLSQGERARVMLARALVGDPDLLLLDEPAAGLDLPARELLVAALERVQAPAMMLATHHLEELPRTVTHAALLRAGRLVASGPADLVLDAGPLSDCFGLPLEVHRRDGRWSATAARPGPGPGSRP